MHPELLYHGTTKEFYDKQVARGRYEQSPNPIYLDERVADAIRRANELGVHYQATPLLLIVSRDKVIGRLRYLQDKLEIDFLNQGEYLPFDIPKVRVSEDAKKFFGEVRYQVKRQFELIFNV